MMLFLDDFDHEKDDDDHDECRCPLFGHFDTIDGDDDGLLRASMHARKHICTRTFIHKHTRSLSLSCTNAHVSRTQHSHAGSRRWL
jgi:hypothetical protein